MKNEIISIAKKSLADKIGFASYKSFDKNDAIFKIYPNVKTVICIAFRVLRGIYRGAYEGTTYYQYTTMGVENMEETIMPDASIKIANFLFITYSKKYCFRYCPVNELGFCEISSGVPQAMTSPPKSPPSGPRSTT